MIKKFLIYGLIVMLLIVSLFVFTGCSSKETEEKNEEVVESNGDSQDGQEPKNEKKNLFELHGLKKEACLPTFEYTEVIEGEDVAVVVINLPVNKVLTKNEIDQYRLQVANAILEGSDDKKIYDGNGIKELVSEVERSCGTYVYTTSGNKYRMIVAMYPKAGEPIQIIFEKM